MIHLALFSKVGRLSKAQTRRFNAEFVSVLEKALGQHDCAVVLRSHLFRKPQIALAEGCLSKYDRKYRVVRVELSRFERVGIMLQMLMQEWRLVSVPNKGIMIVVSRSKFLVASD